MLFNCRLNHLKHLERWSLRLLLGQSRRNGSRADIGQQDAGSVDFNLQTILFKSLILKRSKVKGKRFTDPPVDLRRRFAKQVAEMSPACESSATPCGACICIERVDDSSLLKTNSFDSVSIELIDSIYTYLRSFPGSARTSGVWMEPSNFAPPTPSEWMRNQSQYCP